MKYRKINEQPDSFSPPSNAPSGFNVGDKVNILRGGFAGTSGQITQLHPGNHATVNNGFGDVRYHQDDLEHSSDSVNEMSVEKLRAYRRAAKQDYVDKVNTDRSKSIQRAKYVQKADLKMMKEDGEGVPVNNVGGDKIGGTVGDPPGGNQKKILRRLTPKFSETQRKRRG